MRRHGTKRAVIGLGLAASLLGAGGLAGAARAADYYVDKNSIGGACSDDNPGTLARPWRTIDKANSALEAGDTVHLRRGIYADEQIKPARSGVAGRMITYKNYNNEDVTLSGGSRLNSPVSIHERRYIRVTGIKVRRPNWRWATISHSDHIYIEGCVFDRVKPDIRGMNYSPYRIQFSEQIYHRNCLWTMEDQTSNHDVYMVAVHDLSNSKFEGCTFGNTVHVCLAHLRSYDPATGKLNPRTKRRNYIVIRNCIFKCEWHSQLSVGGLSATQYWLAENNVIYNSGKSAHQRPLMSKRRKGRPPGINPALYVGGLNNVVRRNILYNNGTNLLFRGLQEIDRPSNVWVYHNTVYDTDANDANRINNLSAARSAGTFIYSESGTSKNPAAEMLVGYHLLNNIFWKCEGTVRGEAFRVYNSYGGTSPHDNVLKANLFGAPGKTIKGLWAQHGTRTVEWLEDNDPQWVDGTHVVDQDPLFTDADDRDFTLQPASPAIDAGAWLTAIRSATANRQASIRVENATPFYSGAGAPWFIEGDVGDTIKTEHGRIATIQSIDYENNVLTVSPAIHIVKGEGLALDYEGSAPDLGACEYRGGRRTDRKSKRK